MSVDASLPAAYALGTTMATLPAIESTAYGTTYTATPGGGGSSPIYYDSIPWGKITGDINDQKDLIAALEQLKEDAAEAVIAQIGTIFVYKGQVPTYADLPTDAEKGDCWNVEADGANYIWNGTDWDKLSETIDLSGYLTKEEFEDIIELYYTKAELDELINGLEEQINSKASKEELEQEAEERQLAIQNAVDSMNEIISGLQGNITEEIEALQATDSNLDAAIKKVAKDLQDHIDEAETGYVTNAQFQEEQETRAGADTALSGRIDTLAGKAVEYTDISNPENPNRKAVILSNHDGIFGKDTNGNTRLLAMLSKYNIADFGAKDTHTNLNTQRIVTVNDTQAVLTDKLLDQIVLEGANVTIDKQEVTDPDTGFKFNTFTVNTDLSNYYDKEEVDELISDIPVGDNVYTKAETNALLDKKADKFTTLPETAEIGTIGQYTGDTTGDMKNGYFYEYIGEPGVEFTPTGDGCTTEVTVDIEDFKTYLNTLCEGRDFTAEDIISGQIGYHNLTDLYSFSAETADGKFFSIAVPIADLTEAGFVFEPKLGPRQGVTFECNLTDSAWKQVNVQPETDISGKADADNVYTKAEIDELIHDMEVGELRQDLDNEIQAREDADDALDTRVTALENGASTIFHYKGSVATVAALEAIVNPEVGDVYNVEQTGANYAFDGNNWDKLSETIDLTPYDLKADREAADKKIISNIWSNNTMDGGHLYTKMTNNKGGYALIFNESDGGGSQVYDKTDDVISYVGTNLEEGNGAENGVNVQIYSKNKTTNEGVRINVNTQKAYYLKGANVPNPAAREIAVVNDVDLAKAALQEDIDTRATKTELDEVEVVVDNRLSTQDGNIQSLLLQMDTLGQKIEDLKSLDYEIVELYDGSDPEYTNEQKSFMLSGSVTTGTKVTGENITLDEATVYSSAINFTALEDITIKASTFQGTVYKAVTNAMIQLHADDYISIRDCNVIPETAYNGIEIGLSVGLAKSVIIDNVNFDGTFSNNGISIFGMDEGGVVTISNCYFKKLSNVLRLSNRTNTHWTVNIINCTCDEWELGEYGGMILLQDYTSGGAAAADEINMFNKLTINIQNCKKPDGTKIVMPEDLSTICGSQDNNQIMYMWDNWRNHTAYNVNKYPTITIQ